VWVLDRRAFQQIMMRTGLQRIEENVEFLKSVPLLKNLTFDVLCKIADVLELVSIFRKEQTKKFFFPTFPHDDDDAPLEALFIFVATITTNSVCVCLHVYPHN
jgi:hypothetical protein